MNELVARAALVSAPDFEGGVTTSVRRSEIEEALGQNEMPIELVLDLTRYADGEPADTGSVAVSWERDDLERLLDEAEGDEVALTFDREALLHALESDVEAHGIREKVLVLAVAATAAAGGAAAASAEPGAFLGAGAPITQTGGPDDRAFSRAAPVPTPSVSPDDRAFSRAAPVPTPSVSPDDRAVPRSTPAPAPTASPVVSPDDRAVPRSTPAPAPTAAPVVSPDDRAVPRSTPVVAPVAGTASDPGISWAPSPAETAVIAGTIALAITGAFFIVGIARRRIGARPA